MRTFLTIVLAVVCVAANAQKKPKINRALSALEEGQLAEAKMIIDEAIVHEKTKDDPKTWYYRGQIYAALDTANNESGALEEGLRAFDKALELDPEQKSFNSVDFSTGTVVNVDTKKNGWYAYYYNKAIAAYNDESFAPAADNFVTAFAINPADTNAILNAAYSAMAGGDDVGAKNYFEQSYDAGVRDKNVFLQLYNFAVKAEDFEEGLAVIRRGRDAYPSDIDLSKYEINLLIQLKRTEEAKTELEEAIKADPQNPDLYFSLGVLKEETGDKDGALESYESAIEIDSDHYNSNFNKGVMLFKPVNELIKERGGLSYKEKKKEKELTDKINLQLKKALPTWEKLYSLNSTDESVLETLAYIYQSLGQPDKAKKIKGELDALR